MPKYTNLLECNGVAVKYSEISTGYRLKTKKGYYVELEQRTIFNPNRKSARSKDWTIVQYTIFFREKAPVHLEEFSTDDDWKNAIIKTWKEY